MSAQTQPGTIRISCPDGTPYRTTVEVWTGGEWLRIRRLKKAALVITPDGVVARLTTMSVQVNAVVRPAMVSTGETS